MRCVLGGPIYSIIRKWKLSPSRRFNDRLDPVDFTPSNFAPMGSRDSFAPSNVNATDPVRRRPFFSPSQSR
jgi:hypothetical protein